MSNYEYQNTAAEILLEKVITNKFIGGVLAATPGAGKTTISFIYINKYLSKFPSAKVVVLTHNQNTLKNQYLNDLENSHVKIDFTFGDFNSNAQVQVGIPASFKAENFDKIDLLIVDEAHHYWGEKMVNDIYYSFNPKHVLLLTGSPSVFTQHNIAAKARNMKQYFVHYISGEELMSNNVFSEVAVNTSVTEGSTRIRLARAFDKASACKYNTDKVMVACSTCEEANIAANTMKELGYKVSLSTSEGDKDSAEFKKFLDNTNNCLVVVDRGVLGFSCPELTLLIDMKCSSGLETRFQLIARVLRKHPKNIRKAYISVAKNMKKELTILKGCVNMIKTEVFSKG